MEKSQIRQTMARLAPVAAGSFLGTFTVNFLVSRHQQRRQLRDEYRRGKIDGAVQMYGKYRAETIAKKEARATADFMIPESTMMLAYESGYIAGWYDGTYGCQGSHSFTYGLDGKLLDIYYAGYKAGMADGEDGKPEEPVSGYTEYVLANLTTESFEQTPDEVASAPGCEPTAGGGWADVPEGAPEPHAEAAEPPQSPSDEPDGPEAGAADEVAEKPASPETPDASASTGDEPAGVSPEEAAQIFDRSRLSNIKLGAAHVPPPRPATAQTMQDLLRASAESARRVAPTSDHPDQEIKTTP